MIIITTKHIPFKGFGVMNILGLLLARDMKPQEVDATTKRHESIHTCQQWETVCLAAIASLVLCNIFQSWWYLLGIVVFPFVLYLLGFVIEVVLPPYHNVSLGVVEGDNLNTRLRKFGALLLRIWHDAYRDNCFEREAYANEGVHDYLVTRHSFAWIAYIMPAKSRRKK